MKRVDIAWCQRPSPTLDSLWRNAGEGQEAIWRCLKLNAGEAMAAPRLSSMFCRGIGELRRGHFRDETENRVFGMGSGATGGVKVTDEAEFEMDGEHYLRS